MLIRLINDAHVAGDDNMIYRFTTTDGKSSVHCIFDGWYEANGVDDAGNTYSIVWRITDREAHDRGDEDCCDWDNPDEVICDDTGHPVSNYTILF